MTTRSSCAGGNCRVWPEYGGNDSLGSSNRRTVPEKNRGKQTSGGSGKRSLPMVL